LALEYQASAVGTWVSSVTGAPNFRDIGGLPAPHGRKVKAGMVFRSGQLTDLTPADYALLAPLNVHYVFDLRTDAERALAPTRWQGRVPLITEIAFFDKASGPAKALAELQAEGLDAARARLAMRRATTSFVTDGATAVGRVLRSLARGHMPAVIHCTAGKDRTGVTVAVLLTLLGVPREAIEEDYLRSNDALSVELERFKAGGGSASSFPGGDALAPDVLSVLLGVDRDYLHAAFAAIEGRYGSFDAYAADGLNLSAAELRALRDHLVE
jgi:protein-tyrosine phosphatase